MSRKPISQLNTTYTDTQDGDTLPLDRGGAIGKITFLSFFNGILAKLATGTTSFGTIVAGFGRITTASATSFDLQATATADTHERTRFFRDTTSFRQQTANSGATSTVDDYIATIGASGATKHAWSVAGVERFAFDDDSYTFANSTQALAGLGIVSTAGSPSVIRIGNVRIQVGGGTTNGSGQLAVTWATAFGSTPFVVATPNINGTALATTAFTNTTGTTITTYNPATGLVLPTTGVNYIAVGTHA